MLFYPKRDSRGIPHEHPRVLVAMENFLDRVGWAPIEPAAARANVNFLAEYKTGVETPGNAGVAKAHAGRAARPARDGLSALRRREWMWPTTKRSRSSSRRPVRCLNIASTQSGSSGV
jgi:hypothetical protein